MDWILKQLKKNINKNIITSTEIQSLEQWINNAFLVWTKHHGNVK